MKTDIVIIGAGPVGLFAIFQAGMLDMKVVCIDALKALGGQCSALYPQKPIYDIPAYPKITGQDLIDSLIQQASPFNPTYYLSQQVSDLQKTDDGFIVSTSKGVKIHCKVVVIATGHGAFEHKKPPIDNIDEFENKSVFYFINDTKYFYNQDVVIAGGGDSAIDWAIMLSSIARSVSIVHRRDKFRAADASVNTLRNLAQSGKINIITGYQLEGLVGSNGKLENVILKDLENNIKNIRADSLCCFYGLSQNLGAISNWGFNLHLNHIKVSLPYYSTNIDGIYAVGDIASYEGKLKLILTGFAEAASVMHHAYSKIHGKSLHFEHSTTKGVPVSE